MPISAFLGPGPYGFKPDERPRAPRAPTAAANQQHYRSALRGIGRDPYVCTIQLDEEGVPAAASVAAARATGCLQDPGPFAQLKLKVPPGAPGERKPPPPGQGPPPAAPQYLTAQHDAGLAVGPVTASRFTEPIFRPCVLESINFTLDTQDPANQHFQPLIRFGTDTTAGVQPFDYSVFTNLETVATVQQLVGGERSGGQFNLPLNLNILNTPFTPHLRVINNSGAQPFHITAIWIFRVIEAADLLAYVPSPLSIGRAVTGPAFAPVPRTRLRVRTQQLGTTSGNQYNELELLADQLRTSPFGIPHSEMIIRAGMAGFRDPERAVALASRMAARPPNFALLASRL